MKKTTRRAFLAGVAAAVPVMASAAAGGTVAADSALRNCPRAKDGKNGARFPSVIVQDQHGRKSWFYEDLIADKLVLISFTSVQGEQYYPLLDNLVKAREIIRDRVGDHVHMYSLTTDPHRDTPQSLKTLAERHGADWPFLSGAPEDMREILTAFHARGKLFAVTWIGNEKTGRWLNKPSRLQPLYIAEAAARLSTGKLHKPFLIDMHSV